MPSNPKQLLDGALKQIKSPSLWGKLTGLVTMLVLVLQAYYDIRADVRSAQEGAKEAKVELGQAEMDLRRKGRLSEKETEEAISELQDKMQFIYTESTLLKDRVEDLELENKRFQTRLARYRELSGLPPEEIPEKDLRSLAKLLLPFLSEETEETEDTLSVMSVESPEMDKQPAASSKQPRAKPKSKSEYVDSDGKLKFNEYQGSW